MVGLSLDKHKADAFMGRVMEEFGEPQRQGHTPQPRRVAMV